MHCRSLSFHPDALCLYAGAENHLKVYNWEPVECLYSIATHWGRAADLTIAQNQLVRCAKLHPQFSAVSRFARACISFPT
jgi:hypothetical protein